MDERSGKEESGKERGRCGGVGEEATAWATREAWSGGGNRGRG